jgi:uncharacterized protein (TIGR02145 family)
VFDAYKCFQSISKLINFILIMKKFITVFVAIVFIVLVLESGLFAQVSINLDGTSPHSSAMLDVNSTNKGILIPRLTQFEIASIINPAGGLVVYNTTDEKFYAFILSENHWKELEFGTGLIELAATYTIGTGGSCNNTVVAGNYIKNIALDASNKVTVEAIVTSEGSWNITTDTINGYSFSGMGVFTTPDTLQIELTASGTPLLAEADTFTMTADGNAGTCTFIVNVDDFNCGNTFPYGGKDYNTVQIGTQCWMAENLNVGTMIIGTGSQTNNSTIEKYCYNNSEDTCDTYGGMYQWEEMMQYVSTEGTQGICPNGWHIPTDAEWCTLENYVDDDTVECSTIGWRGGKAGSNLKEAGTVHWQSPNNGATNSSGFTALPGGFRKTDGSFSYMKQYNVFWTSNSDGTSNGFCRELDYSKEETGRASYPQGYGFYVRCIKD